MSCSSRMPPWPWTIAFGRPVVPLEYRTWSGWSNATGVSSSCRVRRPEEPVLPAAAVEMAEPHERAADLGVDLRRLCCGRSRARRSDSRRRRAGPPARSARSGRSPSVHRSPASTRPDRAEARRGEKRRDGLGDVRQVRRDAIAAGRRRARAARPGCARRGAQLAHVSSASGRSSEAWRIATARVVAAAEDVLGIGERRAGGTSARRGICALEHRVGGASKRTSKYSAIDDQKPSRSPTDQRHSSS